MGMGPECEVTGSEILCELGRCCRKADNFPPEVAGGFHALWFVVNGSVYPHPVHHEHPVGIQKGLDGLDRIHDSRTASMDHYPGYLVSKGFTERLEGEGSVDNGFGLCSDIKKMDGSCEYHPLRGLHEIPKSFIAGTSISDSSDRMRRMMTKEMLRGHADSTKSVASFLSSGQCCHIDSSDIRSLAVGAVSQVRITLLISGAAFCVG